jgi:hypothetical protein
MSAEYTAVCECGRSNTVRPDQMGGRHPCYCGFMLLIPTPAEFDRNPVQKAYPSLLRKVSALVADGQLPGTSDCQRCRTPTDREMLAVVSCESSQSTTSGGVSGSTSALVFVFTMIVTVLFAPFIVFFLLRPQPEVVEQHGRDTSVRVPVRLCEVCHRRLLSRQVPLLLGILAGGAVVTAGVAVFAGWWAVIPAVLTLTATGVLIQVNRRRQRADCKALLAPVPVYAELLSAYRFAEVQLPPVG